MANARAVIDIDINTSPAAAGLRDLQAQINGFTTALNRANTEQGLAAKGITRQLSDLVNASRFFSAETVKMQTSAAQLDNTLKKGQVSMGQFFSARFRKDGLAAAQVMSLANARASALQTQFIQTGAAANGMREALAIRPLQAFNNAAVVSAQKIAIQRAMLQQATTQMINFGKNTQWAGRQLMVGFTVPLTIFAGVAGKAFRDLEKEAVNFRKVYGDSFTPPEEMEANLKAVQELAKEYTKYGIAVKDTVGLAAEAAAAGAQNAGLIDATTQATRLATLGAMEQNEALETTIALQNAFKLSGDNLAKSINFLNMVENQTVVTLQDLSAAIPRVAPVIKGLGGSVEDLAAMLAALQEGGVTAEQGANALKSGLASLINPTNRAVEKLKEMGISLDQIVQLNRGDLMGTVQDFARALQTLDSFSRQRALETVFGKFQYARLGALFDNIVRDGSQASRVMETAALSAENLAASAEKELSAIETSPATKFTAAMQQLQLAIAPIGEMFTKMAIPIVNFFVKIIEKFNELPDFAKNFLGLGTVITGIVIPAGTMFLGLLMNLVGTLTKFGHLVGIAFKGFTSGGIKGAFDAVSQAVKYMSLQEIDASLAAQQLRGSTEAVNVALLEQVGSSEAATAGIMGLSGAYDILVQNMREAIALGGLPMAVPGAAMRVAGRGGASNLVGRPLPIVARNKGGSIPYLSEGGRPTVPGVGNRDTVPAMLTPGEFVVNKKATQENIGLLNAINNGQVQYKGMGGGIAKTGKMFYGVQPNMLSLAAQQARARLEQFESSRSTIAGIFGLPASGPTARLARQTQFTRLASGKKSSDIYSALQGKNTSGADLLRQAVALGMKPEELGLKAVGNLILDMSSSTNSKMAFGTLSRGQILSELGSKQVYSPIAAQIQKYFGKSFDDKLFDSIYRQELAKLPAQGITNARFEKATRNALRRYLDSAKDSGGNPMFSKNDRKSFMRDILQADTVRSGVEVGKIRSLLNRNGIPFDESTGDILATINGKQYNFSNLTGRSIENLGRPAGIARYDKLDVRKGMVRVHANKGGMIPGVQYLRFGGMPQAIRSMAGLFSTRTGLPGVSRGRAALNERFLQASSQMGIRTPSKGINLEGSITGAGKRGSFIEGLSLQRGHMASARRNGDFSYHPGLMFWQGKDVNRGLVSKGLTGQQIADDFLRIEKSGLHPASLMMVGGQELGLNAKQLKQVQIAYNKILRGLSSKKNSSRVFKDKEFTEYTESILRRTLDKKTFDAFYNVGTVRSSGKSVATTSFDDFVKTVGIRRNKGGMIPGVQYFNARMLQRVVQPLAGRRSRQPGRITSPQQQRDIEGQLATWLGGGMNRVNIRELSKLGLARSHEEKELFRGMVLRPRDTSRPRFSPEIHDAFYRYARSGNVDDLSGVLGKPIALGPRSFSKSKKATREFSEATSKDDASFTFKIKDERGIYGIDPYQKVGAAKQSSSYREQKKSYKKEKEIIPLGRPEKGRPDVVVGRIALDKDGMIVIDTGAKLSRREIASVTKEYDAMIATRYAPKDEIRSAQTQVQEIRNKYLTLKSRGSNVSSKEAGDLYTALTSLEAALLGKGLIGRTNRDKKALLKIGTTVRSMADDLTLMFNRAKANGLNKGGFLSPTLAMNNGNIVPGIGNRDTVPAMLTPGEFVVNQKATQENLGLLHAINGGKVQMLNQGGVAGEVQRIDGKYYVDDGKGGTKGPYKNARAASRAAAQIRKASTPKMPGMKGMGASMGLAMGGMGVMMFGQQMQAKAAQEGKTSSMGDILSTSGIALSMASILPFMGKFGIALGAVAAILGPLALSFKNMRQNLDKASAEAMKAGQNFGGVAGRMEEITRATGYQFSASRAQSRMFKFTEQEVGAASQFSDYFESEQGQAFIDELKGNGIEKRYKKVSEMITLAIADGMDPQTAKAYGDAIAFYTNDAMLKARLTTDFKSGKFQKGTDRLVSLLQERESAVSREVSRQGRIESVGYGVGGGLAQRLRQTGGNALFGNEALFGIGGGALGLGAGMFGGAAAGAAFAAGGTAIGATLGSVVPIVGTLIGAALGTLVGVGIGKFINSKEIEKLEKNSEIAAATIGSSLEVLKDVANAEQAIIEARRNNVISATEAETQLAEVREVEAKAAGRLKEALSLTATGMDVDTSSIEAAMKNNLIITGGFSADQAQALIETVSFDKVATTMGLDAEVAKNTADQRELVLGVMVETLSGITPENMAQRVTDIEESFAGAKDILLEAARSGLELTPEEIRSIITEQGSTRSARAAMVAASGEEGPQIEDAFAKVTGGTSSSQLRQELVQKEREAQERLAKAEAAVEAETQFLVNTQTGAGGVGGIVDNLNFAKADLATREQTLRVQAREQGLDFEELIKTDRVYLNLKETIAAYEDQINELKDTQGLTSDILQKAQAEEKKAKDELAAATKALREEEEKMPSLEKTQDGWKVVGTDIELVGRNAEEAATSLRTLYTQAEDDSRAGQVGTQFIDEDNLDTELTRLKEAATRGGRDFSEVLSEAMLTSMSPEAIDALMGNDRLLEILFPQEDLNAVKEELLFLQTMASKDIGLAAPEVKNEIDRASESFGNLVSQNDAFLTSIGTNKDEINTAFASLTDLDLMKSISENETEFQRFANMTKALADLPGIDIQVMMKTETGKDPEKVAENIKDALKDISEIDFKKEFGDNWEEMQGAAMAIDAQAFINMARSMGVPFEQIDEKFKEVLSDVDTLRDKFAKAFDPNTGLLKKVTVPIITEVYGQELPNAEAIAAALNDALPDGFNPMILPIIAQLSMDPRLAEVLNNPDAIASLAKYIQSGGTESQTYTPMETVSSPYGAYNVAGPEISWGDYVGANVVGGSPFSGVTPPGNNNNGGGGQKDKSIMEMLKEMLDEAKGIFKGLNKFFTSNTKSFKQFIAGPFAPEFLEFLQSQGKKGIDLLEKGAGAVLKAYKRFEKIKINQAAVEALTAPLSRAYDIANQLGQMNFDQALMGRGLSNERIEYVADAIGPEKMAAYQRLRSKGKGGRTKSEQKEFEALRRDIGAAVAQSEAATTLSQLSAIQSSLNDTRTSFQTFSTLASKGIDPIMAQSLMDLGVSAEVANNMTQEQLNDLANAVRQNKITEAAKEISVALKEMANETTFSGLLTAAGYSSELASELRQVGVTFEMMQDNPQLVRQIALELNNLKAAAEAAKDPLQRISETIDFQISALQAEMERYNITKIRPLEDELDLINESIRSKERDVDLEERKKEAYEDNIDSLEKEKDSLQETYDERVKALEKVANINERIARQQQSQLDIASALSRGDIAGAAAAALAAKQEEARQRIEETRATITAEFEANREAIDEKIKTNRLEIEAIDTRIKDMQLEIRDIQDQAYNKQLEIDAARKEQLKTEEKIYKMQLLQNIIQARSALFEAVRTKNKEKIAAAQSSLGALVSTAGGTEEERNQFFSGISGAGQVLGEATAATAKSPDLLVAEAFNAVDTLTTAIKDNASQIVKRLMEARGLTEEEAQKFLDDLLAEGGGPAQIINALSQAGVDLVSMFMPGGEATGNVPALLDVIGNSVLASSNYIAGMPTLAEGMYNAFKGMKKILEGKINEGKAVAGSIRAAIDAWNNRPKDDGGEKRGGKTGAFGGFFAFGGMINYKGSREPAPGMMYGGKMRKFAYGSWVPGQGMTDKVPALLTPGEFVVRKSVASQYGPLLTALNSNVFPKMNMSGAMPKSSSNTRDGIQYNYDIDVNVAGTNASPDEIAQAVMYRIKRIDDRQVRGTKLG